jgi:hypothetical protein
MSNLQPHNHPHVPGGFSAHLNTAPDTSVNLSREVLGTPEQQASVAAIARGPQPNGPSTAFARGTELILDFWERDEDGEVEAVSRVTLRADGTVRRISATITTDVDNLANEQWFRSSGSLAAGIRAAVDSK